MLYFAYGSNMSHSQMEDRCRGARFVDAACLEGHRFVYDGHSDARGGAVANIVQESKDDVVWGGLFEITDVHLAELDRCEGYPEDYAKKEANVITMDGDLVTATTYCRTGMAPGEPSEAYREVVKAGAADCDLPDAYVKNNL